MARRHEIIIEENGTQSVEEVKSTKEVLEVVLSYTDFFTPEEDSISQEFIERNEFNELATYNWTNKDMLELHFRKFLFSIISCCKKTV